MKTIEFSNVYTMIDYIYGNYSYIPKANKMCLPPLAYDTETMEDYGMYAQQFGCINLEQTEAVYCIERRNENTLLRDVIEYLNSKTILSTIRKKGRPYIDIYIHNANYDLAMQYKELDDYGKTLKKYDSLFNNGDMLQLRFDRVRVRDSFQLSKSSLAQTTKKNTHFQKSASDDMHTRYHDVSTELTEQEHEYCRNDVLGVCEYILNLPSQFPIVADHTELPATQTGLPRLYFKDKDNKALQRMNSWVRRGKLDLTTYNKLRNAQRGGLTCIYPNQDKKIHKNVHHVDITSSYPSAMTLPVYPVGEWQHVDDMKKSDYFNYSKSNCVVGRILIKNAKLKPLAAPCIPSFNTVIKNAKTLNGKIISADLVSLWVCDINISNILACYDVESFAVIEPMISTRGKIPRTHLDIVFDFYARKTELKGVAGAEKEYEGSKPLLNGIYGVMATNPVRPITTLEDGVLTTTECEDIEVALEEYNTARSRFYRYEWGIYIAAQGQAQLIEGVNEIIKQGGSPIYSDTDSVFYTGDVDWTALNESIAKRTNHYATSPDGVKRYLGVWTVEEDADRFCTTGAKSYVEERDGELFFTVAGVSKQVVKQHFIDNNLTMNDFSKPIYIGREKTGKLMSDLREIPNKYPMIYLIPVPWSNNPDSIALDIITFKGMERELTIH